MADAGVAAPASRPPSQFNSLPPPDQGEKKSFNKIASSPRWKISIEIVTRWAATPCCNVSKISRKEDWFDIYVPLYILSKKGSRVFVDVKGGGGGARILVFRGARNQWKSMVHYCETPRIASSLFSILFGTGRGKKKGRKKVSVADGGR